MSNREEKALKGKTRVDVRVYDQQGEVLFERSGEWMSGLMELDIPPLTPVGKIEVEPTEVKVWHDAE